MRVFVTGGTGLIGYRLVKQLLQRGHQPVVVTRRYGTARQMLGTEADLVEGDPMKPGDWQDRLVECDAVLHLAGENVFAHRWSTKFKQLLVDSRIQSTRLVVEALKRQPRRGDGQPKVLVNASAIGYYGPHGNEELTEDSPPGNDFLARLCVDWEKEALAAQVAGVRVAMVRVGVVLDSAGGALAKLLTPFRLFLGGPVGSGRQIMSWIHHEDLINLFLLPLDNAQASGPLNGTAPNPLTNKEFSRILGKVLHRPSFFWTPGFMLRLGLGEVANVITAGQRVVPRKALHLGYTFKYPLLEAALTEILEAK